MGDFYSHLLARASNLKRISAGAGTLPNYFLVKHIPKDPHALRAQLKPEAEKWTAWRAEARLVGD